MVSVILKLLTFIPDKEIADYEYTNDYQSDLEIHGFPPYYSCRQKKGLD